ncbi:glycoside hydrolase family 6 protein [Streptomyces lunaelactis]|uniref:glycoside hydrolase family 6 protein n=1 Tax=Streptomyces lunaelactis TaxID=1535768 RepID=UPI0027B91692|nr:glycoside hydrolase family 6 protein [Streptomyces lunaelactis]
MDNPFARASAYVNPDYAELVDDSISQTDDASVKAKMETVQTYPTAVWLDRIAAVHGGDANAGRKSLRDHLDLALAQKKQGQPLTATFVVYDLPGRDCAALASNGELPLTQAGLNRYKSEYIDAISDVFKDAKYADIRITTVIEPDGLPNLVTNAASDPECQQAKSSGIQVKAVQYALEKLHGIANVYTYMDFAHSGWLGWDNNLKQTVQLYTDVAKGTPAGLASVDGLITNVANYTPLTEPFVTDPDKMIGGAQVKGSKYYEWNPNFDEADFTKNVHKELVTQGWPTSTGMVIDTSRNGWGGAARPSVASTSTTLDTWVSESKVDRRAHRGLWCNVSGAGIGAPPQSSPVGNPDSYIDAFLWVKPPGESDGASEDIENDEGKRQDPMCDPTFSAPAGGNNKTGALPNAPLAGHWFHDQFEMLVKNAYPAIPEAGAGDSEAPSAPAGVTSTGKTATSVSLSWAAATDNIGVTGYDVYRNGTKVNSAAVTGTVYTDSGLKASTAYTYTVKARDKAGNSSAASSGLAVTTDAGGGGQDTQAPTVPTGVTSTATTTSTASLAWTASSDDTGVTGYDVYRGATKVNAAPVTTTGYTDTGLQADKDYTYTVKARDAAGNVSGASTQITARTKPVASGSGKDWLHTAGNQIVDENGNKVWLTGANWFGFNASERVFHGLWSANMETITKEMSQRGINTLRVPISTQLLLEWKEGRAAVPNGVNYYENPELKDKTSLQIFDAFLAMAEKYGMKVMLDVHSAEADNSGHIYPVWWKGSITSEQFYSAWEWVTDRYKTNDTIVAMDVKNEPHGKQTESPRAKWDGSTDQDNFKYACQTAGRRILAINPNVLVMCEGIEIYPKDGINWTSTTEADYDFNWWGGNLRGAKDHPVDLGDQQDQLVYSPHDYGPLVYQQPWFEGDWNRTTLERDVWDPNWLYLHKSNTAPLLIGEWGGMLDNGPNQKWMTALRDLIVENKIHQTFWCINPNSGDTGGLLNNDWKTWDEAKYSLLKPALWQSGGKFVSLDHQVKLGGAASTTGLSLADLYGGEGPGQDTQAPSAPSGVKVSAKTSTTVALSWTASSDDTAVTGYDIYRGGVKAGTSVSASFTDTGLSAGTTYTYTVKARDAAGNISAGSAPLSATTETGGGSDTTAPSVPGGLNTTGKTTSSVTLSWTASSDNTGGSGIAGYQVFRNGVQVATPTGTTYTDTGLSAGTTYTYTVKARDVAGNISAASAPVSATTETGNPGETPLSQGKRAWASSTENGGSGPELAVDGKGDTRWSSAFQDNQWINVDLGSSKTLSKVVLKWEGAYAKGFKVQVSDDPDFGTWKDLYTTSNGTGGTQTLDVNGQGRYVRILGQTRATPYGISLYELQVYGK